MKYLLINDIEKLKNKLNNARYPLNSYWANYLYLAGLNPIGEFEALAPLAWLVTGSKKFEKNIRSVFLKLSQTLPSADASIEAQFHSYTMGAPVARFAIFLDWIWDSNILTKNERNLLSGRIIDAVYSHCYLHLQGRLPAGDNQQASMAFACAVTGYIFGVKRGSSVAAQKMFKEGITRYPYILKSLYPGGWSGEGSTYHCQVTAPVFALFTAFMEQVTGKDYFNLKLGKSTIRENLQFACDIINTAGLLPGWDEYGVCAPELKTHLVYLAEKTGNFKPLDLIKRYGMWSENEVLAWYNDDKVWSIIFWPNNSTPAKVSDKNKSWLRQEVCGKITSTDNKIELLQMWDIIEAGRPSRTHINPNNIEICTNGFVHTVDGKGTAPISDIFAVPHEKMFTEEDKISAYSSINFWATQNGEKLCKSEIDKQALTFMQTWSKECAYSTMNAHSVIIPDNEGYKFLHEGNIGTGEALTDLPSLKAITGDVSSFYSRLWGINKMRRTSLIINDEFILLYDSFTSDKEHDYGWQLMLRPEVKINKNNAVQLLDEGGFLHLTTTQDYNFSLTEIEKYPKVFEQKTHKISFHKKFAGQGNFAVAIKPSTGKKIIKDIAKKWFVCGGTEEIPANLFAGANKTNLASEYLGQLFDTDYMWFGKKVSLSANEVQNIERISIARGQVEKLEVFVNGRQAKPVLTAPGITKTVSRNNKSDGRFWESHFNLQGLIKGGENKIAICSSEFRGQVISGPILLLKIVKPTAPALSLQEHKEYLEVHSGCKKWLVVPDNNSSRELRLPDSLKTNAQRVLLGENVEVFSRTTKVNSRKFTLGSNKKIELELKQGTFFIDLMGRENLLVNISCGQSQLQIKSGIICECSGNLTEKIFIKTGKTISLFSYSHCISAAADPEQFYQVSLQEKNMGNEFTSSYEQACHPPAAENIKEKLLASLHSREWREQVSAVEEIGEYKHIWAAEELIKMFEQEEKKNIYMKINKNWLFSKMKITFNSYADTNFPEDAKRRYRLKMVILKTLGSLKTGAAEKIIIRTLKRSTDFYPVMVQACQAASKLSLKSALPILNDLSLAFEKNTREAAIQAKYEITAALTLKNSYGESLAKSNSEKTYAQMSLK